MSLNYRSITGVRCKILNAAAWRGGRLIGILTGRHFNIPQLIHQVPDYLIRLETGLLHEDYSCPFPLANGFAAPFLAVPPPALIVASKRVAYRSFLVWSHVAVPSSDTRAQRVYCYGDVFPTHLEAYSIEERHVGHHTCQGLQLVS